MSKTQRDRALKLAREAGSLTTRVAASEGIHNQVLTRLVKDGQLERVARGLYRPPDAPVTPHHGLALVAAAAPDAVVCLLSAVSFHGVGTQVPGMVWIALDRRARKPSIEWPPVRVVRFGPETLAAGVETHRVEGVDVRVYALAKTLADLFKYRNKVGIDMALEALGESWRDGRVRVDEVMRYARLCRVERVMRPYLQAIVT